MKRLILLLSFAAIVLAASEDAEYCNLTYTYVPEEYDAMRVRIISFKDESGEMYFEDLTQSRIELEADINHVTLFLYTRYNPANGKLLKIKDLNPLLNSNVYNPTLRNYFITHGFRNDGSSAFNTLIKREILLKEDANVFVVDWGVLAWKLNYFTARNAVPDVGAFVGNYIILMIDHFKLQPTAFRLIGHSLGAHVSGHIGDRVKINRGYVDYIIGLDPAGPLFSIGNKHNRLDERDAAYVQIIYTSINVLGWGVPLGHANFFANGGRRQPGCGPDPIGTCAHSRAYELFAESVATGGFLSRICENYDEYEAGNCNENPTAYFGRLVPDRKACGQYHFKTKDQRPFSYT